jgi:RNA polymerase sigma factor (sigma-70 family)
MSGIRNGSRRSGVLITMDLMEPAVAEWRDALVDLYRERQVALVRLAYLLTGDRAAAEEIVQDAFVAAQRSWDGVRAPAPYVRAAVVNRCRSWGRHQQVRRRWDPAVLEPVSQQPDELWDALQRLTPRQRAAIVMRFYADLPDDEIATAIGCRPATVRTAIHRGLTALRKEIER